MLSGVLEVEHWLKMGYLKTGKMGEGLCSLT